MSLRFHRYGVLLLFLALLSAPACSSNSSTSPNATGPSALTAESGAESTVTAEPVTLRPEFLPGIPCVASRAFGARIIVVVGGTHTTVRGLRFRFTDRFGVTALPAVRPIPGPSPMTIPVTTIPPLSGIPIPGIAPAPPSTMSQASNAQRFPFFLTFGCGMSANGLVVVTGEMVGANGGSVTREVSVPLG